MRLMAIMLMLVLLPACAIHRSTPLERAVRGDGPGNPLAVQGTIQETVRNLPKSRRGNPPMYTVMGQSYRVMDSAANYREGGTASWYGRKFHGRETSSGEVYDMHQMTAAHKSLPLPTFVQVTRTDTGQSIVVKVNDRGPFVDGRIIDLSYAAATQLDMLGNGTAPVVVEALSTHNSETAKPVMAAVPNGQAIPVAGGYFIQLGAFRSNSNAQQLLQRIQPHTQLDAGISHDPEALLYRVRLGPVQDAAQLQTALGSLASQGIDDYTMVSVPH